MTIGSNAIERVIADSHEVMASNVFGQPGINAVFAIMEFLREFYRHVEPGRVVAEIVVFQRIGTDPNAAGTPGQPLLELASISQVALNGIALELRADEGLLRHELRDINIQSLRETAVVYRYKSNEDWFIAGPQEKKVPKLQPAQSSQFCGNTFFDLSEALRYYAEAFVKETSCPIFSQAWADSNRYFFVAGPEVFMRRSLTHFLKCRLGAGYEVRPEQIMDESHPVDIKVTKSLTNRLMIIEIKWLGNSLNEKNEVTATHRDARAKSGATQLADYLDQNKQQAPLHITHGFYVIVDGRRQGLDAGPAPITREQAYYYIDKDIVFNPDYHSIRRDFDRPHRMYAAPNYPN